MSSPSPDDYAFLKAPWKPITEFSMKNITSPRNKIQIDDGVKEGVVAWTDSINAVDGLDDDIHSDDDVKRMNKGAIHPKIVIDGNVQEASYIDNPASAETDSPDGDSSIDDGAPMNRMKITDTDDETSLYIDTQCVAVPTCIAKSGDHRKVVSHIFGRNKSCTRDLPHDLWIFWCRKHYQRFKYRGEDNDNWHMRQMELVCDQLQIFEDWGKVRSWTIALRKAEHRNMVKINKEAKMNQEGVMVANPTPPCWERFLVPYLGANKTFADVREVLVVILSKFDEEEYKSRDKKLKTLPGVEFLPNIHAAKVVKKPAPAKKGETAYKKITLDQAAFKRRTRANAEYAKEQAMKKAEASNAPKSSRAPSQKTKSPYTDSEADSPAALKREASIPDINTIILTDATHSPVDRTHTSKGPKHKCQTPVSKAAPLADQHNGQPTKRRRLTRGYEKHGCDHADVMFMGKEELGETEDENALQERV